MRCQTTSNIYLGSCYDLYHCGCFLQTTEHTAQMPVSTSSCNPSTHSFPTLCYLIICDTHDISASLQKILKNNYIAVSYNAIYFWYKYTMATRQLQCDVNWLVFLRIQNVTSYMWLVFVNPVTHIYIYIYV